MSQSHNNMEGGALSFESIAQLSVGKHSSIDLCRIVGGQPYGALAAVKRLPADLSDDDDTRNMFRDEIWMTAALDHPNITKLLGWGEDEHGLYFALEFVRGVSMARLMRTVFRTGEAFTERLVVFIAAQVCHGLDHAHALRSPKGEFLNLVHRDLTPSNILLTFDGQVKITDFGLAKAKRRMTMTAVGMTKGEPAYMSPEQVMGKPLDRRSDIFTLGIWLFELFAQRKPWTIKGVTDAFEKIVQGSAPDLGPICPKLDSALVDIVARCLHNDPEQRFGSAAELGAQLDKWLRLHGYDNNDETLGRFCRRNAMRQMRWIDRALAGDALQDGPSPLELSTDEASLKVPPERESRSGPTDPTRASIQGLRARSDSGSIPEGVEPAPVSAVTQPTRHGSGASPSSAMGVASRPAGSAPAGSAPPGHSSPPMSSGGMATPSGHGGAMPSQHGMPSGAYGRAPQPPRVPSAPPSETSRPIDLVPHQSHLEDPAPLSSTRSENAVTARRRLDTPPHTQRRRDTAPPMGATQDGPVAIQEQAPSTIAVPDTVTEGPPLEEPSTLRRLSVHAELQELMKRMQKQAEQRVSEARAASQDAHAAAARAESASRAAHVAAAAAERAQEALQRAAYAVQLANQGDVDNAMAEAQRAKVNGDPK